MGGTDTAKRSCPVHTVANAHPSTISGRNSGGLFSRNCGSTASPRFPGLALRPATIGLWVTTAGAPDVPELLNQDQMGLSELAALRAAGKYNSKYG